MVGNASPRGCSTHASAERSRPQRAPRASSRSAEPERDSDQTSVQNVTLAIFLTLTVLGSVPLAVTQNIYGVVMLLNVTLLIRWWRGRIAAEAA